MPTVAKSARGRRRSIRRLLALASSIVGAALVASLGWALVRASLWMGEIERPTLSREARLGTSFAESLARLSYDLPFTIRNPVEIPGVCIIYLDEKEAHALETKPTAWNRALHAQLLRRLTGEGARAVFFDIVFPDRSDPAVDDDFAAAIRENGRVTLGGGREIAYDSNTNLLVIQERVIPPLAIFRAAAAGWGLLTFHPLDADYGVRRFYTGTETVPSATWRTAVMLDAPLLNTPGERAMPRWINYYGPPHSFPSIGYARAIAADGVPAGFFKDRIVFVGGRSTLGDLTLGKDEYRNPHSRLGAEFSNGVEVHLTMLLNLLRGDWLRRMDSSMELWLALVAGVLLGGLLPLVRPHLAALAAFLAIAAVVAFALWEFAQQRTWFAWCIPAFIQAPVALVWAVGTRYFLEERRRNALRDAFGHYLSPQMADRIADADFDLSPGGEVVEASLLITDLEGYTTLAERLNDPDLVSRVLIDYFSVTTKHIVDTDGTIINLVGDAVFGVWGTLVRDKDHARKAALAAWNLHQSSKIEVDGRPLRTRVGLHTGRVLAGNIGSVDRFDYAVVGDAVNFTSRLEGLNKFLGTDILMSDAIRQLIGDGFTTRCLGEFRVVGRKEGVVIHELLGPAQPGNPAPWMTTFADGLGAFRRGDLDQAERAMRDTIAAHDGTDGPATFYLNKIAELRKTGLPPNWTGTVEFTEK